MVLFLKFSNLSTSKNSELKFGAVLIAGVANSEALKPAAFFSLLYSQGSTTDGYSAKCVFGFLLKHLVLK